MEDEILKKLIEQEEQNSQDLRAEADDLLKKHYMALGAWRHSQNLAHSLRSRHAELSKAKTEQAGAELQAAGRHPLLDMAHMEDQHAAVQEASK